MKVDRVVARVADALHETPHLVALLLVGSTARGDRHAKSDVDFLALIDDDVPWPLEIPDGGRQSWSDASGFVVEVGYTSISRVRSRALAEADAGQPWRLQLFTEGRLLAGGGPKFEQLATEMMMRFQAGPPPLTEHDRRWEGFDLWCKLRAIEGRMDNPAATTLLEFQAFEQLLRLAFRLTPTWQPRTYELQQRLITLDKQLDLWSRQFTATNDPQERLELLQLIAKHFVERHGLPLSGNYTSGPKEDATGEKGARDGEAP